MRPDGSHQAPVKLRQLPKILIGATLSPDGSKLAFVQGTDQDFSGYFSATSMIRDTIVEFVVYDFPKRKLKSAFSHNNSIGAITFSPDGRKVAFVAGYEESEGFTSTIRVANSDGTNVKQLTKGPRDSDPRFTIDGKQIMYSKGRSMYKGDYESTPHVIYIEGAGDKELSSEQLLISAAVFSRDHKFSVESESSEIQLRDLRSGALKQLTNSRGDNDNPRFSPDGERIAWQSNRAGNFEIYVMNRDGTGQKRLTQNKVDDYIAGWR